AELLAALADLVAEDRRRERRVDEAGRDQVHADGRELEREVPRQRWKAGTERSDEREPGRGAPSAGSAPEEWRLGRATPAHGGARNLDRQKKMRAAVAARLLEVEAGQRRVVRPGAGDEHVVDGPAQIGEKPFEPLEIGGVESGRARTELSSDPAQAVGIARSEDHFGAPGPSQPARLETDARAAADHDYRLSVQHWNPYEEESASIASFAVTTALA